MVVGRGEIWAVGRVFQHLETQMINGFNGVVCRVWACIVMQHFLRQFLSTCLISRLGHCSRCSLSIVEFGIWQIVHLLWQRGGSWIQKGLCPY